MRGSSSLILLLLATLVLPLALLLIGNPFVAVPVAAAVVLVAAWLLLRTSFERAVAEQEAQVRGARLESVAHLAQAVGGASLEDVSARVAEAAGRLVPLSSVQLWIAEGDEVVLRAETGATGAIAGPRPRRRLGEGLPGRAAAAREALVVEDAHSDPRAVGPERDREDQWRSCAQIPLLVGDRCCGVLGLYTGERHAFTREEIEVLSAFAGQAALAIDNARLYETASARLRRLEALRAIDRRISQPLDPEVVLNHISREATELLGGISSSVYLVDGDKLAARAWHGMGEWIRDVRLPVDSGLTGAILQRREGMILNDYPSSPHAREPFKRINDRVIVQPLLASGGVLGVIYVNRSRSEAPFTPDDLAVLGDFATQAAVALEHSRLYAEVSQRAARLRSLAETGRLLAATFDTSRILKIVSVQCLEGLDVDDVAIYLLDEDGAHLRLLTIAPATAEPAHIMVMVAGEGAAGRAIREQTPVWTVDALEDPSIWYRPETRAQLVGRNRRALMAVPFARERTVGALLVGRPLGMSFTPDETEFASTLTSQIAVALENARLFALERRRRAQIETLAHIERELAAELNVDRLLDLIIHRASKLLEAQGVIFLLEDGRILIPHAWYGLGPWVRDLRVPVGEGLAGVCARERRGLIQNDLPAARVAGPESARPGIRRSMAQPLLVRDRLLGVISVNRGVESAPFTEADLTTFETFAIQAAIALENARLYHDAQRHAEHLEALDVVNRQVASSLELEEALQNIAGAAARFFDTPYVAVWLADAVTRTLTRTAVVGGPELSARLPSELAFGEGGAGWVAEHRAPILWVDLEEDRRPVGRALALRHGLRYFAALPLLLGDRLLGVISMRRATPQPVPPEAETLIKSLTAHAATALEHARLYAETTTRLEETRSLLEVAQILNSTLESRRLLKQVAIKIAQVCGVDRCTIELWQDGRTVPVMSQFADGHAEPDLWRKFVAQLPRDPAKIPAHARAIATRAPVVISDAADTTLIPREWVETYGLRSSMFVPLLRQDAVMGIMHLDYNRRRGAFSPRQINLAMAIAAQFAFALDNTRLYAEVQERLRETTTLLAVGQVLSQAGPLEEIMRRVAREVGRALGADTVAACMLDARTEALVPVAGYHVPPRVREQFGQRPLPLARFPAFEEAARRGRAMSSSDPGHDPRFDHEWIAGLGPSSVLFVPTRVRGETTGGLFLLWWRTGREATAAEIRLVEGVASQVGLAMENLELTRHTQEKLRETETLLEVSRSLTSTLDLPALLREFLRHVQGVLGSDSVGIWLREGDSPWMQPVVGYRVPRERLPGIRQARISITDHPFYAEAIRTKSPQTSSEVAEDPRFPPELLSEATRHRAQLFVPIVAKDVVIGGFIAVWWTECREFAPSELALMEAVASQAGAAIDNARLFSDNQRRLEELALLHELSQAVTGQLDRAALVETIYRQLAHVLDAPAGGIVSYDETTQEFEVLWTVKDGVPDAGAIGRRSPFGTGLMSRAVQERRTIRVDDYIETCRREGVTPLDVAAPYPYWLGAPMVAGDEVVGVIALRSGSRPFTDADARLLTNIAGLAGLAFRSSRLYEERTRAYSELVAAQDHLLRADKLRALGEMASGVAHDFNNLLASIVGRAQMLLRKVDEPRLRQWLQVIERAALDGAQTVRRLQEFTRIRRDQAFIPADLNEVAREALEVTQYRWRDDVVSRGLELDVRTSFAGLAYVHGDPVELREALTNLILNALDAMPSGGTLTIETRVVAAAVVLSVVDTGEGMTDEVRHRLFEPFFTTKGPKGTGLGLSMTFGIVSRHGGRIDVKSVPGQGTRFDLCFPLATAAVEAVPLPGRVADSSEPVRCLIVDDEEPVRDMLGDVLTMAGHTTVLAASGGEAIERFRAEPFDLVLTDLGMPGVTGWQVARACKAARPDVPVLLVTGWGVELSGEELAAHGVDAVLSKPLKIDQVLNAVAAYRRKIT
jgi:GAF domain-containing protein